MVAASSVDGSTSDDVVSYTRFAPRIARLVVSTVFCAICLVGFLHVLMMPVGVTGVVLSFSYMVALLMLQLLYFGRETPWFRRPWSSLALLLQAGLVYLPILQFQQAWVGMPGFLAGSVLLTLTPAVAWPAFALVVMSMGVAQAQFGGTYVDVVYTSVSTVITGLVVYGLSRLAGLVREVHEVRTELAEMAVAQERLRFARDLHDLLGYSLSTITLKTELTHRLVNRQPARAKEELGEILEISRRALVDVRSVASGYRELSLDEECRSVHSVLTAAGVQVRINQEYEDLPIRVSTVLATVLREAATNVLRHSRAKNCEVTVGCTDDNAFVEMINDGVAAVSSDRDFGGGSGLDNLTHRLGELSGELVSEIDSGNRFRLYAYAPLRVPDEDERVVA
ncbi:two-component sensor histidine kinase [Actinopolyspora erythraea]|uniref:Two-component sensor histidine kinase n=1 Tax=Actinopolyspora erythraea TaxID=414996 RepID=A0A223RWN9_9ACTN|nr:two-component sensor histidine kinase [Actinopolyspora erythraea]